MTPFAAHPDGANIVLLIQGLVCGVPILFVGVYVLAYPPIKAWRRGYHPAAWFLFTMVSFNPVFVLVLLGMLPDRKKMRDRERYAARLDKKLARIGVGPRADAGGGPIDASIGDAATAAPRDRSIGDDATRM